MAYNADSFNRGWNQTVQILFQPFRLFFWLKVTILAFFIQGYSFFSLDSLLQDMPQIDQLEQVSERLLQELPLILGALIGSAIFAVFMDFFRAFSRLMQLDAVRNGEIHYRQSIQKHLSGSISLFIWNIAMKVLFIFLCLVGFFILLIMTLLLSSLLGNQIGLIFSLTIDIVILLLALLVIFAYGILLDGVVIPQMAIKSKGILDSWKEALGWVSRFPQELLGFAFMRIAITLLFLLSFTFLSFFVSLFTLGFSSIGMEQVLMGTGGGLKEGFLSQILYLPVYFLMLWVLLPIPLLKDAYTLYFLHALHRDPDYAPRSGISPQQNGIEPQVETRIPSSEKPEIKNETDNSQGPVSFKDIPTEKQNSSSDSTKPSESDQNENKIPIPPTIE